MKLDVNKTQLTIMGVQFDNRTDFNGALYAISSNMIEGWQPTKQDVEQVKHYLSVKHKENTIIKNSYEQYRYEDPKNLYTYANSDVLRNKFTIKSASELQVKEFRIVTQKILSLFQQPISVSSMEDIQRIHGHLFEEIYDWAGDFRQVNISKDGNPFMPMQAFETGSQYMNRLIENYHRHKGNEVSIIKLLAEILDNLNHMHPFREGNGRVQREAIRVLALAKGYGLEINVDKDDAVYHLYMDGTINGDIRLLEELFAKIMKKME